MKTKTQNQSKAVKMFAKAKAAGHLIACTFSKGGGYDPITDMQSAPITEVIDCLRSNYAAGQIDGQAIQSDDFELFTLRSLFLTLTPKTQGLKVTVSGKVCTIVSIVSDPDDITLTLQVR